MTRVLMVLLALTMASIATAADAPKKSGAAKKTTTPSRTRP